MNWHEDVPLTRQAGPVIQKICQYLSDLTSRLLQALPALFHPLLPMNIPDRKAPRNQTRNSINPPLSVVIRLKPKRGLSAGILICSGNRGFWRENLAKPNNKKV